VFLVKRFWEFGVQNWLGSSSLTSNVTLRGGFFVLIQLIMYHVLWTFTLPNNRIWKVKSLQLFQSFSVFVWGCVDTSKFLTSNKLTCKELHTNSTNALICLGEDPMVRFPFSTYTWP
jgi:hypothetical protein